MRILSWVQNKINKKPENKRPNEGYMGSAHFNNEPKNTKEEHSDWPDSLLSIGTFGNKGLVGDSNRYNSSESSLSSRDPLNSQRYFSESSYSSHDPLNSQRYNSSECSSSSHYPSNFSVEEVTKLRKEIIRQSELKSKSIHCESEIESTEKTDPSLEKFPNCPLSSEIDQETFQKFCEHLDTAEDGDISPDTRIVIRKAKELLADKRETTINKKSFKFLLKKLFVCKGGFATTPSFRDPLPETRMEKLLRTIFKNKMQSQYSVPTQLKYLEKKHRDDKGLDNGAKESAECSSKWVKTDSEYIVLEI